MRTVPALAALLMALVLPVDAACPHAGDLSRPVVQTVAGSGRAGIDDGLIRDASFIEPDGVAAGPNGAVYIADGGAHQIRKIAGGRVSTVAGIAPAGATSQQRIGGYLDGDARAARFNRPFGLAVGKDGAIYVADSLNGAIRKIKFGKVTTLSKGFAEPRAVAVDTDGNVYVGDWSATRGLVEISPDGTTSVLANTRNVCGVSVKGSGKSRLLAYTDFQGVHMLAGSKLKSLNFDQVVEPTVEGHTLGFACGVAIFDQDSVVVSDAVTNSVKFVRFPILGDVASGAMVKTIAGGYRPGSIAVGGYRDGTSEESLVDVPRGLAVASGAVLLADAGNRRVRRIVGVDPRGPVSLDANGALMHPVFPSGSYRVVMLSNSLAFVNSLWTDSIAGQVEKGLLRDGRSLGLTRCPAVIQYRISGGTLSYLSNFLSSFYGDGEADLVIFMLDNGMLTGEVQKLAAASKSTGIPVSWKTSVSADLRQLAAQMRENGTQLLLVAVPDGHSISPLEENGREALGPNLLDFYTNDRPGYLTYKMAREYADVIQSSGARTLALLEPMIRFEESSARYPLFNPLDYHPSPQGNMWIGRAVFDYLRSWQPWTDATR